MPGVDLGCQKAKPTKAGADILRTREERRNGHQPTEIQGSKLRNLRDEFRKGSLAHAGLRRFSSQVYLQQDAQALTLVPCEPLESLSEPEGIEGMNPLEELQSCLRLVRLQVPDEMPGSGKAREARDLLLGLLNAILSKVAYPRFPSLLHTIRRDRLGNGYQFHIVGAPAGATAGRRHAVSNLLYVFLDLHSQGQRAPAILPFVRLRPGALFARSPEWYDSFLESRMLPFYYGPALTRRVPRRCMSPKQVSAGGSPTKARGRKPLSRRGIFITLEGIDGTGKSTQLRLLVRHLRKLGYPVRPTREPGGTRVGERIRSILLASTTEKLAPLAELALIYAARAQHLEEVVRPALERGEVVVSDRYNDASFAYQGYVRAFDRTVCGGTQPDLTLLLDQPPEAALARAKGRENRRRSRLGRFETQGLQFHARVRRGYLAIARREKSRVRIIKADGSVDEVQASIRRVVDEFLARES
jgi:dTMP kinase